MTHKMAWNRNALHCALAPGASDRDITVALVQVMAQHPTGCLYCWSRCWVLVKMLWKPYGITRLQWLKTKWPPVFRRHFQLDFLEWKCLNFDQNCFEVCSQASNWISIQISLKFVPRHPINDIPALWPGDKPLFEPMMVSLVTHTCITWPQWVIHWGLVMPYGDRDLG